jgi:pimeloyl-ACP methyl ester carboxylesterase
MAEPTRKSISLDGGAMSYLEWVASGVPLNFAHANGFNAETYKSVLAPLADDFHVFASDQRGHGFSTLPATPGLAKGWTIYRDDLVAYLGRIAREPVILAGHSMGGTASFMAAALAPELVRALVLFEPVFVAPVSDFNPRPDLASRTLKRRDVFPSFEAALEAYRCRGIFASWSDAMVEDYLSGGLIERTDGAWALACSPAWESESFRETPLSVSRLAPQVKCPITIVHGTRNSTAFESEIAGIVNARPDTRVVRVDGASHFLPMEWPEIVREEIVRMRDILARQRGRKA